MMLMRQPWFCCVALFWLVGNAGLIGAMAPIQLVPEPEPAFEVAFSGSTQELRLTLHNPNASPVTAALHAQQFQVSSAVAAPLGPSKLCRTIPVLANQTVVESVPCSFPAFRATAVCRVRWTLDDQVRLGTTEVRVIPREALAELAVLAGHQPLVLQNPPPDLVPTLQSNKVTFDEDVEGVPERPAGRLALVFGSEPATDTEGVSARRVQAWLEAGMGVVWFKSPAGLEMSGVLVRQGAAGRGTLVVAPSDRVAGLAAKARAQWNLLTLTRLAASRPTAPTENPP